MSDFNNIGSINRNLLYKNRNEVVEIYSTILFSNLSDNSLQLLKISDDNIVTDITPNDLIFSNISDSLTQVKLTMPDENCFVCCIFNDKNVLLKVGNPSLKLVLYKPDLNINHSINIKQYNYQDHIKYEDTMLNLGLGFYAYDLSDYYFEDDFIEVIIIDNDQNILGKIISRIRSLEQNQQSTVTLQTIYYDWE